jgi:transcriptional regulator with XRE-family HTH domain
MSGCHCEACRGANTAYEKHRSRERGKGRWNGLVSAEPARLHILALSREHVGRRSVARASGVSLTVVTEVRQGRKARVRAMTLRKILAVRAHEARAMHAYVDARPTRSRIMRLVREGWPKARLARRLGYRRGAIQFLEQDLVTRRTAARVARLYRELQPC